MIRSRLKVKLRIFFFCTLGTNGLIPNERSSSEYEPISTFGKKRKVPRIQPSQTRKNIREYVAVWVKMRSHTKKDFYSVLYGRRPLHFEVVLFLLSLFCLFVCLLILFSLSVYLQKTCSFIELQCNFRIWLSPNYSHFLVIAKVHLNLYTHTLTHKYTHSRTHLGKNTETAY